ncbi:hybrid sensor histidine kinase/response regulator [Roseateles sp.]|uniref:sensor histidine kinase n=1 Tax=Roseateles sp. TaxID=1971397 RepID=UPI0031DAB679
MSPNGPAGPASPAPVRLLIVDDEARHMEALRDTLSGHGYEVAGHASAASALSELRRRPFDVLLTDLVMPGMTGIELLRAALQIDPQLVGIVMTGEGSIATAVEAMRSGATDYVLKPFRLASILPVLGRAVEIGRLRRENTALQASLRQRADELEASNRELDAFTRSVSHDLRTPLNALLGFSVLLQQTVQTLSPRERSWLEGIQQAAEHMTHLIEALMRLSQMGRRALALAPVDVAALVGEVVDEQRRVAGAAAVRFVVGEMPPVVADGPMLRQVFANLIGNAVKYASRSEPPREATIRIGGERDGAEAVFFVSDDGPGFDPADAERLFDAFIRLKGADGVEGHGVGLSIVQRIVQRHGGRVWAVSAPGQGATFRFALPAQPQG